MCRKLLIPVVCVLGLVAACSKAPRARPTQQLQSFGPSDTPITVSGVTADEGGWRIERGTAGAVPLFEAARGRCLRAPFRQLGAPCCSVGIPCPSSRVRDEQSERRRTLAATGSVGGTCVRRAAEHARQRRTRSGYPRERAPRLARSGYARQRRTRGG